MPTTMVSLLPTLPPPFQEQSSTLLSTPMQLHSLVQPTSQMLTSSINVQANAQIAAPTTIVQLVFWGITLKMGAARILVPLVLAIGNLKMECVKNSVTKSARAAEIHGLNAKSVQTCT